MTLLLLPLAAAAAADPAVLHKKARARMKSLDFDAALPLLEQLKADPSLSPQRRLDVLIDLGITHVNLGQSEDAKRDFDDALGVNEDARPPASASPKVQRVFDEAKEARALRLHPPPPEPKPEPPPPPPEQAKLVPRPEPKPEPSPVPVVEEAPPKQRMVVLPLVMLVAGAAAIGAGALFAMQSQDAKRTIEGSLHTGAEVTALESKRTMFGTLTYVGYGTGAAIMVAGAAMFIFSGSF